MMPFTATKLGAVQGSVIVIGELLTAGLSKVRSSTWADASLAGLKQISNARGVTITRATWRAISSRSAKAAAGSVLPIPTSCLRTPSQTRLSASGAGTRATLPASAFCRAHAIATVIIKAVDENGSRASQAVSGSADRASRRRLSVQFQNMDIVGETVEQRAGKALASKDARPFLEWEIRREMVDPRQTQPLSISLTLSCDELCHQHANK